MASARRNSSLSAPDHSLIDSGDNGRSESVATRRLFARFRSGFDELETPEVNVDSL